MNRSKAFLNKISKFTLSKEDVDEIHNHLGNAKIPSSSAGLFNWWSSDSEETWNTNVSKRKSDLEKNGWLDYTIEYNINSHGFRDVEFYEDTESYVCVGECFTFGPGLPKTMTWPNILQEKIGRKVFNLSISETGLDQAFRVLYYWLPIIKPKKVLMLESGHLMREFIIEDKSEIVFTHSPQILQDIANNKYERFLLRQKNILAIQQLCDMHEIPLVIITSEERDMLGKNMFENGNADNEKYFVARDLIHPGYKFHKIISAEFYKYL